MRTIMSKIHLELLDRKRQKVFNDLSFFKNEAYLAGGTALALQINHRKSEDFDVFVRKQIDNSLRLKINKVFGDVVFYLNTDDQLNFNTLDGIKVTFLWYYFESIGKLVGTESISLSSVDDIIADKAMTVGRRAIWRDYVDLFFLMKEKSIGLEKIISLAKRKFKGEFVETQFLEQLCYFSDLKISHIEFINKTYSNDEIKSYLEREVRAYLKKKLGKS